MKIGDEVYIHGYVDEIRKDTVIIRNAGGYFGTTENEIRYSVRGLGPRGTWLPHPMYKDWAVCSECGVAAQKTEDFTFPFCPWCCAEMNTDVRLTQIHGLVFEDSGKTVGDHLQEGKNND